MNNKKITALICSLIIVLILTNALVSIHTMQTDISLLKSQNRLLQNDVDMLRVEQEKLNSRQKYTPTVKEVEVVLDKLAEVKTVTDTMAMRYRTLDEILIQMFGGKK